MYAQYNEDLFGRAASQTGEVVLTNKLSCDENHRQHVSRSLSPALARVDLSLACSNPVID